jgi:hypothetical protein
LFEKILFPQRESVSLCRRRGAKDQEVGVLSHHIIDERGLPRRANTGFEIVRRNLSVVNQDGSFKDACFFDRACPEFKTAT